LTAEAVTPTPDIERTGKRMLLLAAVQHAILCPFTNLVLDVRDAVYVEIPGRGTAVMHSTVWDLRAEQTLAKFPDAEVIDGRTL
jgi:hypothetical protein